MICTSHKDKTVFWLDTTWVAVWFISGTKPKWPESEKCDCCWLLFDMWDFFYPSSFLSPDWLVWQQYHFPSSCGPLSFCEQQSQLLVVIIRIIYATNVETSCFCAFVLRIEAISGGHSPSLWAGLFCTTLFCTECRSLKWQWTGTQCFSQTYSGGICCLFTGTGALNSHKH